jgi:hypothetical protein
MRAFPLQGWISGTALFPRRGKEQGHEEDKPVNHQVFSWDRRGSIKITGLYKSDEISPHSRER